MSFKTFLEKAGEDILKVVTFGTAVAKAAEPVIDIADPALGALWASTVSAVTLAEATGTAAASSASAGSTSAQKLALVTAAIEPQALAFAQSVGVSAPTSAQIEAWVNGIVASLNAFTLPATTTTTATTTTQAPASSVAATAVAPAA